MLIGLCNLRKKEKTIGMLGDQLNKLQNGWGSFLLKLRLRKIFDKMGQHKQMARYLTIPRSPVCTWTRSTQN